MLSYWFYPNPGNVEYSNPKVILLFGVCAFLFLVSFAVSKWRKNHHNSVTRKLAKSWGAALRWFSMIAIVLIVSRVEDIQFVAMRFLWVLWGIAILGFVGLQAWLWKRKHYTVVPKTGYEDPRAKYLPRKK